MSSARFPGKVLSQIQGLSLVEIIYRRVAGCLGPSDQLVLVTSTDPADDLLEITAHEIGLPVFRGSLSDVLGRVIDAASCLDADGVVRLNGDSPMVEPGIVDEAVDIMRRSPVDLVSTKGNGCLPYGIGAEVIAVETLRKVHQYASQSEKEHVTKVLYNSPGFDVFYLPCMNWPSRSSLQLTIDRRRDLRILSDTLNERGLDVLTCHYWEVADD